MIRLVLLAFFLAAPAFAETPLTRLADGRLAAPVRIAGAASAPFVVDTGAETCAISRRTAAALHLLKVKREGAPTLVIAPAVEIDGARVGDLKGALLESAPAGADGVIGADVLSRFVVAFDTRRMRLSLHGGAQHGQALVSPRARLVYAERMAGGRLAAPATLNGANGVAIVDTGAPRSTFNMRFAEAAGVERVRADAFQLAGTTRMIAPRIADLPEFARLGEAERPAMLLGLDRLDGLKLVLDYPRRRMWFDPG